MGLDITAYSNIEKVDCLFDGDGEPVNPETREPIRDYFKVVSNADFPGRENPLEHGEVYRFEKSLGVHAGSYSGYNRWRDQLAELSGWPLGEYEQWGTKWKSHAASAWDATEGPFLKLIRFSDCKGTLGPDACREIFEDFKQFQEKADAHQDTWFKLKYSEWRSAFELAAQNGAITFH